MRVIIDTEWSGFEDSAHCWCIVCRDIDTGEVYVFEHPTAREFRDFASRVHLWVGHNLIGFDRPKLARIGVRLLGSVIDTLVVSRILNFNIVGGHSLEAWAGRLPAIAGSREIFLDKSENPGIIESSLRYLIDHLEVKSLCVSICKSFPSFKAVIRDQVIDQRKIDIKDFSVYTADLLYRCVADTKINLALFWFQERFINDPRFISAIATEQQSAELCVQLEANGFALDVQLVTRLHSDLRDRLATLDAELAHAFPPKRVLQSQITPRVSKSGSMYAVDLRRLASAGINDAQPGKTYDIYADVPFNPASHKDIIERLNDAKWKPTEKTKGHIEALKTRGLAAERRAHFRTYGWTLSEDNLSTLPAVAPQAAQRLVERLLLASRVALLSKWEFLVKPDGRIHGKFFHIGAWTQRKSHQNPNMANVPKVVHPDNPTPIQILSDGINADMRRAWIAPKGRRLVGVDADGIQMRIFAHYVNDTRLIKALIDGRKEDKTDIHSLHKTALGHACKSRDAAKRFIYAWLLGAGVGKVSQILECSYDEAAAAVASFLEFYPGLQILKRKIIPADAKRGYFIGLDGRLVVCSDAHLMLAGYLQDGESIIMKRACNSWNDQLTREGIDYLFVNDVHDEWQTEVPDSDEIANYVQDRQIAAIVAQGPSLGLNCPLAGTGVQGRNWLETH